MITGTVIGQMHWSQDKLTSSAGAKDNEDSETRVTHVSWLFKWKIVMVDYKRRMHLGLGHLNSITGALNYDNIPQSDSLVSRKSYKKSSCLAWREQHSDICTGVGINLPVVLVLSITVTDALVSG